METVGRVLARWWATSGAPYSELRAMRHSLGLVPLRCCDSCPFEGYDERRMLRHRVFCDTFQAAMMADRGEILPL